MTTPTVIELIRNGNPVESASEPAHRASGASAPLAPTPSTRLLNVAQRPGASHRRLAFPPAERTPSLSLAA